VLALFSNVFVFRHKVSRIQRRNKQFSTPNGDYATKNQKEILTKFYGYFFGFGILTNGMKFTIRAQKRNNVSRRQIHNRSLSRLYAVDRRRRMYK